MLPTHGRNPTRAKCTVCWPCSRPGLSDQTAAGSAFHARLQDPALGTTGSCSPVPHPPVSYHEAVSHHPLQFPRLPLVRAPDVRTPGPLLGLGTPADTGGRLEPTGFPHELRLPVPCAGLQAALTQLLCATWASSAAGPACPGLLANPDVATRGRLPRHSRVFSPTGLGSSSTGHLMGGPHASPLLNAFQIGKHIPRPMVGGQLCPRPAELFSGALASP